MELFHGTDQPSATNILGPPLAIDVSLGRGELGRGFYAGSEPSLAASLARVRHSTQPAVLQINIDNREYIKLSVEIIKWRHYLQQKWKLLIKEKKTTTYQFGKDVILAPFATFDIGHQYKFESKTAERLLNNSAIEQIYPK